MKRNNKGISLIVLSITILVMAILAATVIIALEDSGIIGRSKNTVKNNNYADEYTRLVVIKNGILTDILGTITVDEFVAELQNKGIITATVNNGDGTKTVTTTSGFNVKISQDGISNLNIEVEGYTPPNSNVGGNTGGNTGSDTPTPTPTTYKLSGKWTFNDQLTQTGWASGTVVKHEQVNFYILVDGSSSTGESTSFDYYPAGTMEQSFASNENRNCSTILMNASRLYMLYHFEGCSGGASCITIGKTNSTYKIVDFGSTPQVVSEEFYNWFIANATKGVVTTSTATITSASITPNTMFVCPSATVKIAATLNKGNKTETLNYRVVIDEYAFNSNGTAITKTGEQEIYTFSSSDENITYTYNANSRVSTSYFFIVNLEVLDSSNNILDTYAFTHNKYVESYLDLSFDYSYRTACMPAGTLILVEEEYEDENGKKKKRRKKKKIEDLTYDDDLVVWDFDNACFTTSKPIWLMKKQYADEYNELTFSNGAVLKTVREHRIFNKELGKFTYPMGEETKIGTTTFTESGEEVQLVNRRVVDEKVEYYNVITNYHINAFAEGILTSCRLSNLYDIKDMKYVKDDREIMSVKEFKGISEEYYHGLRLGEQRKNVNNEGDFSDLNSWTEYVNRLIGWAKKK